MLDNGGAIWFIVGLCLLALALGGMIQWATTDDTLPSIGDYEIPRDLHCAEGESIVVVDSAPFVVCQQ